MSRVRTILAAIVVLLAGCVPDDILLSPPPNLYLGNSNYPANEVPVVLRNIEPRMFYMTNRQPKEQDGRVAGYDTGRSPSMAFGVARVRYGARSWDELVERTHVDTGRGMSSLELRTLGEVVRFSDTPLAMERRNGRLEVTAESRAQYAREAARFKAAVRAEIARTGNRNVLVYVHGVNNQFHDSLTALANFWHYSGRRSIPIAFTWPAGNRGALGYFRDSESGEYSAFHLKEFLRLLAEVPEVRRIDIVAHSQGTEVVSQAVRDLVIYHNARGEDPQRKMKTGILIYAAADLDVGVVRQRLLTERFSNAFEQVNLYINPYDSALRLSGLLTNGQRVGAVSPEQLDQKEVAQFQELEKINLIRVENVRGTGHTYFRSNPAVMSDIVLALRTRADPGTALRPLDQGKNGFWQIHPNYPLARLPANARR